MANRRELIERLMKATDICQITSNSFRTIAAIDREELKDKIQAAVAVEPSANIALEVEKELPWDQERTATLDKIHNVVLTAFDEAAWSDEELETACNFFESSVGVRYVSAKGAMSVKLETTIRTHLEHMRHLLLKELTKQWLEAQAKPGLS
jgi:hypothetical protein